MYSSASVNCPTDGTTIPKQNKTMPAPAVTNSQNCTVTCKWHAELEHKFNSFSVGKPFRYDGAKITIVKYFNVG